MSANVTSSRLDLFRTTISLMIMIYMYLLMAYDNPWVIHARSTAYCAWLGVKMAIKIIIIIIIIN